MDAKIITVRALLQRINRRLNKDFERVYKLRSPRPPYMETYGDYYRVDLQINGVVDTDVDLEDLGRELGVMKAWEKLPDAK